MSTKKEKILYAIHNNPLLIGSLSKDTSISKGMLYRELKKAVPCRVGIEFELSGDFKRGFVNKYHKGNVKKISTDIAVPDHPVPMRYDSKTTTDRIMAKHYGVYEIVSDSYSTEDPERLYEIRVSISNYTQLKGLYLFMQDLPEFCKLHEGGGIHIHIDISEFFPIHRIEIPMKRFIEKHLQEVVSIFPKYTGKYNKRRVGLASKGTYLNVSNKKSFEYRIAPLTFDYSTLIDWIIKCIKFRNKVIHKCKLKKHPELPSPKVSNWDTECSYTTVSNRNDSINTLSSYSVTPYNS